MAGRSARVKKARVKHAQSMARLRNEVELQGAYISTYENFSAYAAGTKTPGNLKLFKPEQRKQRTGYTAAQRKAYEPYMAMVWYKPEDIIDDKGGATSYRGTSNFQLDRFIRYQASSNRPTKGWFQSIANQYKGRALEAEMGGLSRAKEALANAKSFDPNSVGSSRGWRGGTSSATKKGTITGWDPKKQEYIRTGGTGTSNVLSEATKKAQQELSDSYGISTFNLYGGLSTSPTKGSAGARINEKGGANVKVERKHTAEEIASGANPDFKIFDTVYREKVDQTEQLKNAEYADRNQQSIQNTGLSLAVREEQQKLSDDFGILTFDVKGNLSTLPKSGMVNWDALGLSGDQHKERRGKVKEQFGQEIMSSMIPSQMKTQAKKETELEAELKSVNKKMKIYDKWNRQTDSMEHDNSDEYWELAIRKKEITSSLQNINNDQKVIAAALESVDYNTMMHYLAKNDVITEDSRKQYVQFGDPSKASLKQELTAAGYEWEQQRESTSELASAITRLEGLDKNNMGTVRQQESLDKEITRLENYFQIDLDEKGGVDKVVSQLSEQLTLSQKEQHNLKQNKDKLAHQYSSTLTNKERTAAAAGQNRTAAAKNEFEELTGMKAEGTAANALQTWNTNTMNEYYDQRHPELNIWYRDDSDSMQIDFDPDSTSRGKQNEFGNYQGTLSPDAKTLHSSGDWFSQWLNPNYDKPLGTDLTLYGDIDIKKKQELQHKAGILQKYDSWEQANKYISGSLYDYKKDLNTMYSGYYTSPTVTQEEANMARVGTSQVYGDSYVWETSLRTGGVRSGAYERQDYVKLIAEIKKTEQTLEDNLAKEKLRYVELKAAQDAVQAEHSGLRPQISSAVEKGVEHGNITVDRELQKKLSTSSDKLWDARTETALSKTDQMYYEKSLELTEKDRLAIEERKKELDFELIQSRNDATVQRPKAYVSPGRPSLKQHSDSRLQQQDAMRRARRMKA